MPAFEFLRYLAERHRHIRRVLVVPQELQNRPPIGSGVAHAVLYYPWALSAVSTAIDGGAPNRSEYGR